MNSYWKEFYLSFRDIKGFSLTVIGIAISCFTIYFDITAKVEYKKILPIACFIFILLIVIWNLSVKLHFDKTNILPKVKQGRIPHSPFESSYSHFGVDKLTLKSAYGFSF